ncbi:MAG TPA: four helix bundle protein [Gemmatimonadaceae bacterium]
MAQPFRMQSANNLRVTAHARALASEVYRVTAIFPARERYGLTAQMRRAAVSIGANIAEGCGRSGDRELMRFLHIALGSASELEFQLQICADPGLVTEEQSANLTESTVRLKRMMASLIKALRKSLHERPTRP